MLNKFKGLFMEEEGQGMTEYGLILGLIAVVAIAGVSALGGSVKDMFNTVKDKFTTPTT